jgi:hypothetical protein
VVNFRRLLELGKVFEIIHEFIKATAIAALTLVVVGSLQQLVYSVVAVTFILGLYGLHETSHDKLEISDFRLLIDLLNDDEGSVGARVENPNRILKAITRSSSRARRCRTLFIGIAMTLVCGLSWWFLFTSWTTGEELGDFWIAVLGVMDSDDQAYRAGMLLIGSLLIGLHICFEWLRWRETQCIMPPLDAACKTYWDPQLHGVPPGYGLFGLPSMWFSSREAYDDLRLWIAYATGCERIRVTKIFPEEMANLALESSLSGRLRRTLLRAKLYDARTGEFSTRVRMAAGATAAVGAGPEPASMQIVPRPVAAGELPEELGIDLVMYDRLPGRYLKPEEEYTDAVMKSATTNGNL